MEGKAKPNWRYALMKILDRIADRSLEPTLIYIVEKIFPKNTTKEEVLNVINNYPIKWKETYHGVDFYYDRMLFRIDLSKRHKNAWKINPIYLIKKKDGNLKTSIQQVSISVYANEAVAHAFNVKYITNHEDIYPEAGRVIDPFTNIESRRLTGVREREKLITQPPVSAYQGENPDIFISYSHKDKNLIYPQIIWLDKFGFKIWYDEGIPPTSNWEEIIPKRIFDSAIFLVFLSRNAVESDNVKREVSFAIKYKSGNILPIFLEETELSIDLEFNLQRIQSIIKYALSEDRYRKKVLEILKKKF